MGLISKLEDKLSGSDKNDEQKKLEKQQLGSTQQGMDYGQQGGMSSGTSNTMSGGRASELQHPIGSTSGKGSGIVGGTAVTGGAGSEALAGSGSHGYGREGNVSSTSDQLRDTHLGSSTGSDGPRQPFNPYSSKGQQIAANADPGPAGGYGASQNRAEAGDYGSRRSAEDPEVRRTQGGGVSNNMTDQSFVTGPHSQLENRDAVPTAGGHRVGSGATSNMPGSYDTYDNSPSSQHHYGRDAALAGGAGAAGYGTYEATKGRDNGPAPNTAGPHKSDMMNKIDPRVEADPSKSNYARDSAVSGVSGADQYKGQSTKSSTTYPDSTTSSSYEQPGVDRRTYDHDTASKYGQDVSYMNRPTADTPLTQSKDFSERHPHSSTAGVLGAGAGAGALGATALSHKEGDVSEARTVPGGYASQNPSTMQTTSNTQPSVTKSTTSPTTRSDDHETRGSEQAKRMGGAYEAGYRDGYRDAMAHKASQV